MSEGKKKRTREESSIREEEVKFTAPSYPQAPAVEKTSFESWCSLRLSKKDRKEWLKEPVRKFFDSLGLSNEEEIETFDKALEKF